MNPEGGHANFVRKNRFIAYIYIQFNQNFDEKSSLNAKVKAAEHLHAIISTNFGPVPTSNQIVQ